MAAIGSELSDLAKLALKSLSVRMNDERSGDLACVYSILANLIVILSAASLTSVDFGLKKRYSYSMSYFD